MLISRRHLLGGAATGLAAPGLIAPAGAQSRAINLAGASFDMREPILREYARVSRVTPRPWVNPSTQARVDRLRVAQVDAVTLDAPFSLFANEEKLIIPIEVARLRNWDKLNPLLKDGRSGPLAPLGLGANPGRTMYIDDARTKVTYAPLFFQMDSIGYNANFVDAPNNELSWGELFNPKYRGRVALFGIDWLGMLDAALGMKALKLLPDETDPTNLSPKEVDTVVAFLKEKKKEGHFRALWRAYGELVNLMASQEVVIADAWWPVVVEVASKGLPMRYAVAKEGYRAWCVGQSISHNCRDIDMAYEWINWWMDGFAGARQSEIGYYSTVNTFKPFLDNATFESLYEGKGRDGGTLEDRTSKVYVWNTRPKNMEYYTEKWNEFLAA